jgi:hypothetical protein
MMQLWGKDEFPAGSRKTSNSLATANESFVAHTDKNEKNTRAAHRFPGFL